MNAWHRAGRSIGRRVAALATLILLIGGIPPPSDGPSPLPPMTIIDGRLYQDGGIPLPPYYLG